jgi:competence protein ComEA
VAWGLAALVVVLLGARELRGGGGAPAAAPPAPARVEEARPRAAVVHVAGAVRRPGVYRMRPGARIDDALRRAGGATARADLTQVNLAAEVEDGRQIVVPERPRAGSPSAAAPGTAAAPAPGQPLNVNTATLEQLDALDGIGPGLAQRILDAREERGGFSSVDELAEVPGIGEARMASLREQVRV